MLLVLFLPLIYSIIMKEMNMMHAIFKPNFVPYCTARDICKADCACFNTAKCIVLQMDDSVRNHIVYFLNEIRDIQSKGDPSPSGIPIVQYDLQLEQISMCWASQCINDHSDCFATPRFNETSQSVGQMPYKKGETPIVLWNDMLGKWLGGVGILNVEIMTSLPEGEKGEEMYDYAQLLSDKIQFIGCAWASYNDSILYVCTFAPRGPSQGDYICRTGLPCSKCPIGYHCDFKKPFSNLCKPITIRRVEYPARSNPPPPPPPPPLPLPNGNNSSEATATNDKKKGDKKFLRAMTMGITIILIAVVVVMVGGFILYYICVV